ncbi:MAG: Na(+)-translocating NADH-quinone reductase subunit A [Paludibacteraceae bacterium]|nr:Na(+)-translocating NADH-quinone reductase subunit A [Paludibacteraceae bacterium]
MAEVIKIKKGLNINLKGKADKTIGGDVIPVEFAVRPDDFEGVIPRLAVKPGDHVVIGSELFHDKEDVNLKVVAPVSGDVVAVNRGERRKLLNVVIKSDGKFESASFKTALSDLSPEQISECIFNAGFGAFIRRRPFDVIANSNEKPNKIFISAFDSAPLAADYSFTLAGQEKNLQTGIDALKKMTGAPIYLGVNAADAAPFNNLNDVVKTVFDGPHPAGNVGVQINHTAPINKGDIVWTVSPVILAAIGKAFNENVIDFSRTIALAGSGVVAPCYYKTIYGAKIDALTNGKVASGAFRIISGNPLTGTQTTPDGYLGAFDNVVSVIPETTEPEMFGWIMPRLKKFSTNKTYFSWLFGNKEYDIDTNVYGGERAIIVSNEYDKVFPMDIYPEFLIKAIIAQDIDKMIDLGIYEVAPEDFALCEFVDTSKIKLQKLVREGLNYLRKEEA